MKIKKRLFTGEMKRLLEEILGPNAVPPSIELDFGGLGKDMPQSSRDVLVAFIVHFSESAFMALFLDNILANKGMKVRWGGDAIKGVLGLLDKKVDEGFSLNRG